MTSYVGIIYNQIMVQLTKIPKSLRNPQIETRLPIQGSRFKDLTGVVFSDCVVSGLVGFSTNGSSIWLCECNCGGLFLKEGRRLIHDDNKTCGCGLKIEKHGMSDSTEYRIYAGMLNRCFNKNNSIYPYYGGRGITVCQGWRESFVNFLKDLGNRPSKSHSLDRKDNNKHYSCGKCSECRKHGWKKNCHWVGWVQQARNRRRSPKERLITVNGVTKSLSGWGRVLGISREAVRLRLNKCIRLGLDESLAINLRQWQSSYREHTIKNVAK